MRSFQSKFLKAMGLSVLLIVVTLLSPTMGSQKEKSTTIIEVRGGLRTKIKEIEIPVSEAMDIRDELKKVVTASEETDGKEFVDRILHIFHKKGILPSQLTYENLSKLARALAEELVGTCSHEKRVVPKGLFWREKPFHAGIGTLCCVVVIGGAVMCAKLIGNLSILPLNTTSFLTEMLPQELRGLLNLSAYAALSLNGAGVIFPGTPGILYATSVVPISSLERYRTVMWRGKSFFGIWAVLAGVGVYCYTKAYPSDFPWFDVWIAVFGADVIIALF